MSDRSGENAIHEFLRKRRSEDFPVFDKLVQQQLISMFKILVNHGRARGAADEAEMIASETIDEAQGYLNAQFITGHAKYELRQGQKLSNYLKGIMGYVRPGAPGMLLRDYRRAREALDKKHRKYLHELRIERKSGGGKVRALSEASVSRDFVDGAAFSATTVELATLHREEEEEQRKKLLAALRQLQPRERLILNFFFSAEEEADLTNRGYISPEALVRIAESSGYSEEEVKSLVRRFKRIPKMQYSDANVVKYLAIMLSVTTTRVNQIKQEALKQLRDIFSVDIVGLR